MTRTGPVVRFLSRKKIPSLFNCSGCSKPHRRAK
ncbi:rCG30097 [Rattus norvegicus]|uniref:RCG30097 n=1 Tax=Rattus norvegicus TaxID=10116 RepID=A6IMK5_RAT|nr:rCG30097 [Rattus norvegicus]